MYGQTRKGEKIKIQDESGYALKTTATILSLFLFLLSIGIFGFGIWLAVWTNNFKYIDDILNYNIYNAGYVLLIISGLLLFIISIIGMCGSTQENSCIILFLLILSIISEVILVAVATIGLVFNYNFNKNFVANLIFLIQRIYGVNQYITRNQEVTYAIDQIQSQFSCCGASGNTNGSLSWELYNSSTWIIIQNSGRGPPFVPLSCCKINTDQQDLSTKYCQGFLNIGNPSAPPLGKSNTQNPYLNTVSCMTSSSEFVNYFSFAMFGVALGTAIYLLIIIIISFCLLRHIEISKQRKEVIDSKSTLRTNVDCNKT